MTKMLTRRDFLKGTVAAIATVGGTVAFGSSLLEVPGSMSAPSPSPSATSTRNQLYIPPTVSPVGYSLTAAPSSVDIGGGSLSAVWAYNGLLPGPTFRARRGDTARISLLNGLPQQTITHWHGMVVDHVNDGHPSYAIQPGGSYSYNYWINQRAALNWYHPHPDKLTGEQVAMGLAGAFIINDSIEDSLGLPSGVYEIPLVIRDASFDHSGNMKYSATGGGFLGDTPLVNGTVNPKLNVDTARYRFRVLGGANARVFGLALNNGAQLTLIGNDGGLLETSVPINQVDISSGERADLIIDFRGVPVGSSVMLRDARSAWDLLEFDVTRAVSDTGTTPANLSTISRLSNPVTTRDFSFDGMSMINGKVYDINRIDFQVPLGQTELWRFTTGGNGPHPVHVHGASFQVQSRTGGRAQVFPWEQGWKDTVLLEDGETVEVLIRFEAFPGIYLMHCHKLEHEDNGMMSNFEVVGNISSNAGTGGGSGMRPR